MFKKIASFVLLLCFCTILSPAQKKNEQSQTGFEKYQTPGGELVDLRIVNGKQEVFTNKDFETNHHFFLVMFNPTCGHCITMAKLISNNAALFRDSKVAFMATASMMPYLGDFEKETGVYKHPEFVVGVDSAYAVDKLFTYGNLPQINIYDKQAKLIKTFRGDVPLDSLKQYLP